MPQCYLGVQSYEPSGGLGHSVAVAEKHDVDAVRGIPREARTLEAATQVERQLKKEPMPSEATPLLRLT